MDDYQLVLLVISLATFITFLILSFIKEEKNGQWVSWYAKLTLREKKKYNPSIALSRMKKVLVITSLISMSGLILSLYIDERISKATFLLLLIIFILQIQYTGPKSSLIKDENSRED